MTIRFAVSRSQNNSTNNYNEINSIANIKIFYFEIKKKKKRFWRLVTDCHYTHSRNRICIAMKLKIKKKIVFFSLSRVRPVVFIFVLFVACTVAHVQHLMPPMQVMRVQYKKNEKKTHKKNITLKTNRQTIKIEFFIH